MKLIWSIIEIDEKWGGDYGVWRAGGEGALGGEKKESARI